MIVLVDGVTEEAVIARSAADAPEIDGNVIIAGGWDLEPGDFVEVEITGSDTHDLYAEPVL
jgi:ribosomal protein S12 methylthiotransferase